MENSKVVFLINEATRAIRVQYEPHGKTEIAKSLDPDVSAEDMVVMESSTRWNMTTAKVVEVDIDIDLEDSTPVKWIVQRIATDAHAELRKNERAAISAVRSAEHRRKRDELRKSMFADHEPKLKTLALAGSTPETDEVIEPPETPPSS